MPEKPLEERQDYSILLLLAGISLLLKGLIIYGDRIINPDGALYLAAAHYLAGGDLHQSLSIYPMPFYPALLALGHRIIPDWVRAGQALSALSLTLVLLPLFAVGKMIFNRRAAVAACLLYLALPLTNLPSADILREPPFLLFLLTAVWAGSRALDSGKWHYFLLFTGSTALALLCRLEGLLLPLAFLPAAAVTAWHQPDRRPDLARGLAFLLLLPLAGYGLWLLGKIYAFPNFNRLEEIKSRLAPAGPHGFLTTYFQVTTAMKNLARTLPGSNLGNNLLEVSRHYAPLIYLLGIGELFAKAIFPTTLIPLTRQFLFGPAKKSPARLFLFLLLGGYFGLIFLLNINQNFIVERFFLVPVLLLLPWAGAGLNALWQLRQHSGRKAAAALLACSIVIALPLGKTVQKIGGEEVVLKEAAAWLHTYGRQRQFVPAYNDPRLPFYAGRLAEVSSCQPHVGELLASLPPTTNLIALYLSGRRAASLPPIKNFVMRRQFSGSRHQVLVFTRTRPTESKTKRLPSP